MNAERELARSKKQEARYQKKLKRAQFASTLFVNSINTTSKQLLWTMVINSILWVWCSYVLAFMGKDQIAESLSSNVCTVIIGQIIAYFLTKTVENVFKNNNFGGPPNTSESIGHDNTVQVFTAPPFIPQKEEPTNVSEYDTVPGDPESGVEPPTP